MTIFERVDAALATLGTPYACQVYKPASDGSLPPTFLVYFLVSSAAQQHADDGETLRSNIIQVSTYSRSGLVGLPNVDAAMKADGFIPAAKVQMPYDRETGYHGLAQDYEFLEEIS